ncbi:hypothetical protein ACN9M1_03845 [Ralstonia sp. R-29]
MWGKKDDPHGAEVRPWGESPAFVQRLTAYTKGMPNWMQTKAAPT